MNKKFILIIVILVLVSIAFINSNKNVWERKNGKVVDSFKIEFNENSSGAKKLFSRNFSIQDSYDIWTYNGDAKISITNEKGKTKTYSLKKALSGKKITTEDILEKAENDSRNGLNEKEVFADNGEEEGSVIYRYDNYSILKFHTINKINDLYIGSRDLDYTIGK